MLKTIDNALLEISKQTELKFSIRCQIVHSKKDHIIPIEGIEAGFQAEYQITAFLETGSAYWACCVKVFTEDFTEQDIFKMFHDAVSARQDKINAAKKELESL